MEPCYTNVTQLHFTCLKPVGCKFNFGVNEPQRIIANVSYLISNRSERQGFVQHCHWFLLLGVTRPYKLIHTSWKMFALAEVVSLSTFVLSTSTWMFTLIKCNVKYNTERSCDLWQHRSIFWKRIWPVWTDQIYRKRSPNLEFPGCLIIIFDSGDVLSI